MSKPADLPRLLRFGQFQFDLRTGEMYKEGKRIKVQEQPSQVLALLMERPGELVTREELRKRLWPNDTFVDFDHGVNIAINKLRDALGDSAEKPRFIETLPRRGYRFIASVGPLNTSEDSLRSAQVSGAPFERPGSVLIKWRRALLPAFLVLLLVVLLSFFRYRLGPIAENNIRSLAVLPLENLSRDPGQDYFADGMTDELITSLAKLQTLKVISRSSVMRYKGTNKSLPEMARELNVDGIVEGTVLRSGNRVRITAQLVQAATDQHLWAETYEGDMEDVLRLQDSVARAVAAEIRVKLRPEVRESLAKSPSVNPAAYEAYLRGRSYSYSNSKVSEQKYFEEAIARDPQYAPAYAGLSDYYFLHKFSIPDRKDVEKARELAAKALQLDDGLAEAHIAMGNVLFRFDWNWQGAEKEFKRAIELGPNAPSSYLHYAMYSGVLGRHDESIAAMKRAVELDPFSVRINGELGDVFYWAGRYEEAAKQARKTIDLDPSSSSAHSGLAMAYEQLGRYDEAVAEDLEADTLDGLDPSIIADFKRAFASSGINGYRRKKLEWEKQQLDPNYFRMAKLSAELGDKDAAFQWLEKAYQARFFTMANLKVAPGLRSLHGDPRFADLVRRLGLSP